MEELMILMIFAQKSDVRPSYMCCWRGVERIDPRNKKDLIALVIIGQVEVIVITSRASPGMARGLHRHHRKLCHLLSADYAGVRRKAHGRVHSHMALARILHVLVVVGNRRLVGVRLVEDHSSHQLEGDLRVVGHSGHHVGRRRSSRVVEVCDGGSHRGVGCIREEDRGDRSSRHQVVGHHNLRDLRHGIQENEIGNARVVVGSQFEAAQESACDESTRWI